MTYDIVTEKFKELTKGLSPEQSRMKVFEYIRDIPYMIIHRFVDYLDASLEMLRMNKGSCLPKHYLLGIMFQKLDIPIQYVTFPFNWKDIAVNYPQDLKNLAIKLPIEYHLACRVYIEKRWVFIDCTWDVSLKNAGFPVNEKWDGTSDTRNAVNPIEEVVHKNVSDQIECVSKKRDSLTREDKVIYAKFIGNFNKWLDVLRHLPM